MKMFLGKFSLILIGLKLLMIEKSALVLEAEMLMNFDFL